MKRAVLLITALLPIITILAQVLTGIEVLQKNKFESLRGKRVGLITNPTGIDSKMNSTIDLLHKANQVQLTALFAPEHGVRGDYYAGANIKNSIDPITGVPIYSLHGTSKRPSAEMLRNIDVLVYDIQDIGCRSYTFISTLAMTMEAASEQGIEFVVLDRPNPLGGNKVEGCGVDKECKTFVSYLNIPYLYGLTVGELAMMYNAEYLNSRCLLQVIKMEGWKRTMLFTDTNLPWVLPSPHIPSPETALYYPATGIIGELGRFSIGVGYTLPFRIIAHDSLQAIPLSDALNNLQLNGILFRPIHLKPYYAFAQGHNIQGVEIYITNPHTARLQEIQFAVLQEIRRLNPTFNPFQGCTNAQLSMFDKVIGNKQIRKTFSKRYSLDDIRHLLRKGENEFKKRSSHYYLYHQ